eukprot:11651165-Alexandrium_andersonii.AAC.1
MHVAPGAFVGTACQYRLACAASGQDLLALADGADVVSPDQVALVLTEWLSQPVTATAVIALDPTTE